MAGKSKVKESKALKRYLRVHGCKFVQHGGKHEVWETAEGVSFAVPGQLASPRTGEAICRQAGVPPLAHTRQTPAGLSASELKAWRRGETAQAPLRPEPTPKGPK